MNWLVKEEPTHYGFDAFVKDKKAAWSGVRNAPVVGIARAVSNPYPEDKSGKYVAVDLVPVERLPRPVT